MKPQAAQESITDNQVKVVCHLVVCCKSDAIAECGIPGDVVK